MADCWPIDFHKTFHYIGVFFLGEALSLPILTPLRNNIQSGCMMRLWHQPQRSNASTMPGMQSYGPSVYTKEIKKLCSSAINFSHLQHHQCSPSPVVCQRHKCYHTQSKSLAFALSPGPDCLRDVVPKLGHRLKVCAALKCVFDECQVTDRYYLVA